MLLAGELSAFRAAAAVMTVGIVEIVQEVIRTRRLADVPSPLRFRKAHAHTICCSREANESTKGKT